MRLSPVEAVASHLTDDVIVQGVAEEQQAFIILVNGTKYLVQVVQMPSAMEIN